MHLANILCIMSGFGLGADGLLYTLNEQSLDHLGLDKNVEELFLETGNLHEKIEGIRVIS